MSRIRPLNANEKLVRRFYEPLVLLSVLDPTRGARYPDLIVEKGLGPRSKLWRNFLDQLSFICDSVKGGTTVTAIAAQETTEQPIFWVASNSNARYKAQTHLEWIFTCLSGLDGANSVSKAAAEYEIMARCVEFSFSRIKTYTNWLLTAIKNARSKEQETITEEDALLFQGLQRFENFASNPYQLCIFAHEFRGHMAMAILCRRHNAHSIRGIWSDIRHYIGRLGCWKKAVRTLILAAQKFPQYIANAQIALIEPQGPPDIPNKAHTTDLDGVIGRMISAEECGLPERLRQVLSEVNTVIGDLEDRFFDAYANIDPRPHAELLVLEHFSHNNLRFVEDDKYIGCSKPSCYCCDIYFQCHPGGFVPRPCHGNLWINWAPPIPLPKPLQMHDSQNIRVRPQSHHTFQMLQKMLSKIRTDLQDQILSKRPRRDRLPDSTTGMSSFGLMGSSTMAPEDVQPLLQPPANVANLTVFSNVNARDSLSPQRLPPYANWDVSDGHIDSSLGNWTDEEWRDRERFESALSSYGSEESSEGEIEGPNECCAQSEDTNSSSDDDVDVLVFRGRNSSHT